MQSVKYTNLRKFIDLLWNFWMTFQEVILVKPNFFLHNIYLVFWFIWVMQGGSKQAQENLEVKFPTLSSFLSFYVLSWFVSCFDFCFMFHVSCFLFSSCFLSCLFIAFILYVIYKKFQAPSKRWSSKKLELHLWPKAFGSLHSNFDVKVWSIKSQMLLALLISWASLGGPRAKNFLHSKLWHQTLVP